MTTTEILSIAAAIITVFSFVFGIPHLKKIKTIAKDFYSLCKEKISIERSVANLRSEISDSKKIMRKLKQEKENANLKINHLNNELNNARKTIGRLKLANFLEYGIYQNPHLEVKEIIAELLNIGTEQAVEMLIEIADGGNSFCEYNSNEQVYAIEALGETHSSKALHYLKRLNKKEFKHTKYWTSGPYLFDSDYFDAQRECWYEYPNIKGQLSHIMAEIGKKKEFDSKPCIAIQNSIKKLERNQT